MQACGIKQTIQLIGCKIMSTDFQTIRSFIKNCCRKCNFPLLEIRCRNRSNNGSTKRTCLKKNIQHRLRCINPDDYTGRIHHRNIDGFGVGQILTIPVPHCPVIKAPSGIILSYFYLLYIGQEIIDNHRITFRSHIVLIIQIYIPGINTYHIFPVRIPGFPGITGIQS